MNQAVGHMERLCRTCPCLSSVCDVDVVHLYEIAQGFARGSTLAFV